jgi:hypothetical protein
MEGFINEKGEKVGKVQEPLCIIPFLLPYA